jgi:hypothetical protein
MKLLHEGVGWGVGGLYDWVQFDILAGAFVQNHESTIEWYYA